MEPVEADHPFADALAALLAPLRGWLAAVRLFGVQRGFDADAALVMRAARLLAGVDGAIAPEHLLACALHDARLRAAVEARGVDVRAASAALVAAAPVREGMEVTARAVMALRRAYRFAVGRGARAITLGDVVRALAQCAGECARLLGGLDDERLRALDEASRDEVEGRALASGAADQVDVFTVNDDVSTVELVSRVLVEVWGLTPAHAAYVTLETDAKGHGRVGRVGGAEARARVARAEAVARAMRMPLTFALFAV